MGGFFRLRVLTFLYGMVLFRYISNSTNQTMTTKYKSPIEYYVSVEAESAIPQTYKFDYQETAEQAFREIVDRYEYWGYEPVRTITLGWHVPSQNVGNIFTWEHV